MDLGQEYSALDPSSAYVRIRFLQEQKSVWPAMQSNVLYLFTTEAKP